MRVTGMFVIGSSDLRRVSEYIRNYKYMILEDDFASLVLLAEGFGLEEVEERVAKVMRRFSIILAQNPLAGLYLPFFRIVTLEHGKSDVVENYIVFLNKEVSELKKQLDDGRFRQRLLRAVLGDIRRDLVANALALKYFIYLLREPAWKDYVKFYVGNIVSDMLIPQLRRFTDEADLIVLVSLLYLVEVCNKIRETVGLAPLEVTQIKEKVFKMIDDIAEGKVRPDKAEVEFFAVASLIYELAKIKRSKDYLHKAYYVLSNTRVDELHIELKEREMKSRELLAYHGFDEISIEALARPLDDVETALIAKTLRLIDEESVHIPVIGFTDYVSEYYGVSKHVLKLLLKLAKVYYFAQQHIVAVIPSVVGSFFSLLALLSNMFIHALALGVFGIIVGLILNHFIPSLIAKYTENRVMQWVKIVREDAERKLRTLKDRSEYFDFFTDM